MRNKRFGETRKRQPTNIFRRIDQFDANGDAKTRNATDTEVQDAQTGNNLKDILEILG
jgi:hypothetical protein